MTVLRAILLVTAVVTFWYTVVLSTPFIHRAIFTVVPPDGPLDPVERAVYDREITEYIRYWFPDTNDEQYPSLTPSEQSHLDDVMMVNGIIILYVLPALLVGLLLSRFRLTEPFVAPWSSSLVVVVGLVTFLGFDGVFSWFHLLIFPQGNWVFPADEFLITQIYPLEFFAWAWGLVLVFSIVTIGGVQWWGRRVRRNQ